MCWLWSGSFSTAPTIVGDPTERTTFCTAATVSGSRGGIRIERTLPPHDEVGRIVDQAFVLLDVELGDPDVLRLAVAARASRTSTWITATSSGSPSAPANGISDRARHHRDDATMPTSRSPPIAGSGRQLDDQGVDQDDHEGDAPHPGDRGETHREPVVHLRNPEAPPSEPPNGQADRIQSITVHSAAITTALTNGRPGRRQMGTSKPKIATPRASTIVRPVHANAPNRKIQ